MNLLLAHYVPRLVIINMAFTYRYISNELQALKRYLSDYSAFLANMRLYESVLCESSPNRPQGQTDHLG